MTEGVVGGIGDEEKKPEAEPTEALAGAEAFGTGVVARLSGNNPSVARNTKEFLTAQTQLLRVQNEPLNHEYALRLAHLRNQRREESIRRFGLRLRVGYRLFLVLVAAVIGVGDRVRGQYRLENPRSVRAWLQSGINGSGR